MPDDYELLALETWVMGLVKAIIWGIIIFAHTDGE